MSKSDICHDGNLHIGVVVTNNGMRFLIRREAPEEGDAFFHAWVWPGPLIFSLTDDSLKTDFTAPFTNEGKQQVVDWINAQYEDHPEKWSHEKKNLY